MGNIWAVLLQTLWASLAAGLLLIVKRLLEDKLSPRWQYGIWCLLAARLLLPASLRRYVVLPVSEWVELSKTIVEKHLSSAWTAPYAPIVVRSPFPMAAGTPRSVTDWLFVLYCAGIAAVLLRYLAGYLRLRLALRRCPPVPPAVQAAVDRTAERYGLPSCPAVAVDLPSAMVCGVFRPVLALPGGREPDEKILLHELLHLKYHDTAQNVFWSLLRALHWCNPFLWQVFDRVQNDLESLCDQRVLERLEGDARREYGYLLLGQASVRYARFPGTSSISNGAENIRRRVEAVARFQRYPRGMALVSVCIALALGGTVLFGTASAYGSGDFSDKTEASLARTRVQRCTTLAGALDTCAKAVMLKNGYYFATASPLSRQEEVTGVENWESLFPDTPDLIPGSCKIANLRREGNTYHALLVFPALAPEGHTTDAALPVRVWRETPERGVIPGILWQTEWVVERDGDWELFPEGASFRTYSRSREFPYLGNTEARGDMGNLSLKWRTLLYLKNETKQSGSWPLFGSSMVDQSLNPDAQFAYGEIQTEIHYSFQKALQNGASGPEKSVGLQAAPLADPEQDWTFQSDRLTGSGGGGSSDGESNVNEILAEDWDGTAELWMYQTVSDVQDDSVSLPAAYRVRVFWDSFPVETLTIRTEGGGAQ